MHGGMQFVPLLWIIGSPAAAMDVLGAEKAGYLNNLLLRLAKARAPKVQVSDTHCV